MNQKGIKLMQQVGLQFCFLSVLTGSGKSCGRRGWENVHVYEPMSKGEVVSLTQEKKKLREALSNVSQFAA